MSDRFHVVTRLLSVALAGFALLAAAEAPQAEVAAVAPAIVADTAALDQADDAATAASVEISRPASLRALVAQVADLPATADADGRCLAKAVFFEARGEPLEGQLAVAQVILNRVASGRYAGSVCGVVDQPGQFTFARRHADTSSADWRTAAAIATIAQAQRWLQVAPKAMAFHAARVNVSWGGMQRVGRIGNHVFYR